MATIEKPVQEGICEGETPATSDAQCDQLRTETKLEIGKELKRYGLKLREPEDGIPLQNDQKRIRQCAEYFEPMIATLSQWCRDNEIDVDRTLRFTGEIIVHATPDQLRQLQSEAEQLGFFEETKDRSFADERVVTPVRLRPSSPSVTHPA